MIHRVGIASLQSSEKVLVVIGWAEWTFLVACTDGAVETAGLSEREAVVDVVHGPAVLMAQGVCEGEIPPESVA